MTPRLTMTETPDTGIKRVLAHGPLTRFNEAQAGRPEDYRPLAILVSHPDTSEVLGDCGGDTMFSYLHVDLVFVPESLTARWTRSPVDERRGGRSHSTWLPWGMARYL